MKRLLVTLFVVTMTMSIAFGQPPGGRGGPGGGGPGRGGPGGGGPGRGGPEDSGRSPNAVLSAIDSNGDHEITTDEMKNAFSALKALDANNNGRLDRDEIHPEMSGGPSGSPRPRNGGRDGVRDGVRNRGANSQPGGRQDVVERIQGFDKNNDGALTKDEIPKRMHSLVARYDKDKNGVLDKQEQEAMSELLAASVPARGGPRDRRGADGPPGGGRGGPGGGRGGPGGGPPSPEQMIQDAFDFDANQDGLLSRSELQQFAESHAQQGTRGEGTRGGGRGARGGGSRPNRPARPE